jgi:maltose alpha-D-glucosyltransferase / alpha-amylase
VKKLASATDPLWYKDAVIYELHVRAFSDSNGDGIGDFPGLISKLDYLQDLGVTCLWVLPFFPSPLRDDGYDIANYTDVNPSYGTLADFKAFLDAAHARNLQVMIELVINHTSDQHPWFKASRLAPAGSPEREMYVWSESDKLYQDARIIFTDTEKSNWTWDETAKAYYWHRFFAHQPDLNFDNPLVLEEVLKAMRFWLDMGVDGLRMDAIPYLIERDGTSCENLPETHALIRSIRSAIDAEYQNRMVLAEANQWPADVRPYFGEGDECHMAFHFPLMPRIYMALRQEDRLPITDIMAQTPPIPDSCQWGLFLRNHDELTLEMVTADERDYMYFAYSADPRMRVNVGIRRRLAPLVDNNRRRIELLNSLLLSFPGTPILYYGDEIGMGDNIYLGDRNGVRTPMQWTSDRNAGFSRCDPARLYFPVIMDPIYGYQVVNVEAQQTDQSSLLHWTRNMIALRKLFQVFGRGTLRFLTPTNRKVLAYLRDLDRADGTHETVLCLANLSRFAQPVSLDLAAYEGMEPVEMLGYVPFPTITAAPYALSLAPYSFLWLELQPASAVKPEPPRFPQMFSEDNITQTPAEEAFALDVLTRGWQAFLASHGLRVLEQALPAWLQRQRWFGGKARSVHAARVLDWVQLPHAGNALTNGFPALFFIQVEYAEGSSDLYQLPLALSTGDAADNVIGAYPLAVVATLASVRGPAVLHDALMHEDLHRALLDLVGTGAKLSLASLEQPPSEGILHAQPLAAFPRDYAAAPLPSHAGSAEQSNTSIIYDGRFILKLFRRLQSGENPDVEICRFLTETAHFTRIPSFLGQISLTHAAKESCTLAMLSALVANDGDGWQWFQARLAEFFSEIAAMPAPAAGAPLPAAANATLEAAALLGQRTAELHLALATQTSNTAFAAEPMTVDDLARDAARIESQITSVLESVKVKIATLNDTAADHAALLLSRRPALLARACALASLMPGGQRIRVHGDYHLGQTLHTTENGSDFVLLDFEGEPARTLVERRQKQSPLKDVAGMIRSFSYAAFSTLDALQDTRPDGAWALAWQNAASAAFLGRYRETLAANPALLPPPETTDQLLNGYLLEKALYELTYELNNRPAWLPIPLAGILTV